jgi:uncharacterized DUF497 family protein
MFAPQEFEWDEAKEANNRTKQGISFAAATRAFGDPGGLITTRRGPVTARLDAKLSG